MSRTDVLVDVDDVRRATARLAGRIRRTPVISADLPGESPAPHGSAAPVLLKLELLQHTGTFKARGMLNRLLAAGELPAAGVVAASGGNAGLAVAYAARQLGVSAEIFVPESTPPAKVARLREQQAAVVVGGAFYADALRASAVRADRTGALVVHAYDQREVVAGNGTLGRELLEQAEGGLDTVLVAVGGGGLAAGVAVALEGAARVVAVEPEACPTLHAALAAGQPVDVAVGGVAADSLGARRVGEICFAVAQRTGMASVLVPDEAIVAAQRLLWDQLRVVAEPGGAAALAALTHGVYRPAPGERLAAVICGANTDPASLTSPARA